MAPDRLLKLLVQGRAREVLSPELSSVRARRPDLVVWLEDGRLFHLELQSTPDPNLDWRMLEYYLIFRRDLRVEPEQIVLFVGREPLRRAGIIEEAALRFRYKVIYIRDLPAEEMLASESLSDNLIAILCGTQDPESVVRRIL